MRRLKTVSAVGIAVLAACALLVPATAGAKKQVTRPMQTSGSGILSVTGPDTWMATESGQATHLGRYSLEEIGTFSFSEDWSSSVWIGEGTFTAANRDQLHFDITIVCEGGAENGVMEFTGGTGRFAGASGSVDLVSVTDPVTGAYTISGTGTIMY